MPTLEERVAYLEGRFGDHVGAFDDLRSGLSETRTDVRDGLAGVRGEIGELRAESRNSLAAVRGEIGDQRTESRNGLTEFRQDMNHRFERVDHRFERVDRRFEAVDGRFVALDQKIDRHFTWLEGIQVAVLVAVVGALVGSYYK